MVVENATIIIAIGVLITYGIIYIGLSKLLGSLTMMGLGVMTLWYSNTNLTTDTTMYGILGWIIIATGLFLLIGWLLVPQKKKHKKKW